MSTDTAPRAKAAKSGRPNLRLVPDPPKLTAKQARDLAAAEAKYEKAKLAFDKAKDEREKLRDRLRPRLPNREPITIAGILVKRTAYSYQTFSLKGFKEAGHKVSATMRRFVTEQDGETWTVKRVK